MSDEWIDLQQGRAAEHMTDEQLAQALESEAKWKTKLWGTSDPYEQMAIMDEWAAELQAKIEAES